MLLMNKELDLDGSNDLDVGLYWAISSNTDKYSLVAVVNDDGVKTSYFYNENFDVTDAVFYQIELEDPRGGTYRYQ
jgi:hypothetical protein